jgi:hypothetical protein
MKQKITVVVIKHFIKSKFETNIFPFNLCYTFISIINSWNKKEINLKI